MVSHGAMFRPAKRVPAEPADPVSLALNNAVRQLANGKIAFESPLNMKLNETEVVEVRIAKNLNQDLTKGLATSGQVAVEHIKVGSVMAATLHGSAFEITQLTKEKQAATDDNFTAWVWSAHPLDWGKQTLYLNVCVTLQLNNNKEVERCPSVCQRDITVEVAAMYAVTHFVKNNALWTIGVLGAAAGSVHRGIAWMRKREKKQKEPRTPTAGSPT